MSGNAKKLTTVDLLEESDDFEGFIEPSSARNLDSDNLINHISRPTSSHSQELDTSDDLDEEEVDLQLVCHKNQSSDRNEKDPFQAISQPIVIVNEKDPFQAISQPIVIVMDIREPLTTLQKLLEEKLSFKLHNCSFSLQDSQILNHHKNLVDLCVQGEGNVQINCELKKSKTGVKVNIADVLKLDDDFVQMDKEDETECGFEFDDRWAVAYDFCRDQKNLGIPEDPSGWSVSNVRHWLMWAVRQFSLSGIKLSEWELSGAELLRMTREDFKARVPVDPNNSFWIHFELLRSCKIVAINTRPEDYTKTVQESQPLNPASNVGSTKDAVQNTQERVFKINKLIKSSPQEAIEDGDDMAGAVVVENYTSLGTVGPVQLWQFLLELLTNKQHRNAIQWLEDEGEFKLINPELVAHLWGIRKNKPTMNYEKLSRALRYYYDGEMISKVNGKRFTYKFVCDLKQLIGYSASELNSRVIEAELKAKYSTKKEEERAIYVNEFITVVP